MAETLLQKHNWFLYVSPKYSVSQFCTDNAKFGYLESSLFFQLVINLKISNLHNTVDNFQKAFVTGFN